jgi:monolysocardiolipin acyltransferase
MIHQHPDKAMRYFKWGVARLILEAEPCPDVLPMWIDGPQHVMDDKRPWPRPLPRVGRDISINFGELVDTEKVFEPYRKRWQELKARAREQRQRFLTPSSTASDDEKQALANAWPQDGDAPTGLLTDWDLKYGPEAEQLRIDVTLAVRNEVLKVRRATGLPDEDPKRGLAETFRAEGGAGQPRTGPKADGSVVTED